MTMARLAVQEVVSTTRVMEVTAPVQGSRAIKPGRVIREDITIRGISNNSSQVIRASQSS